MRYTILRAPLSLVYRSSRVSMVYMGLTTAAFRSGAAIPRLLCDYKAGNASGRHCGEREREREREREKELIRHGRAHAFLTKDA